MVVLALIVAAVCVWPRSSTGVVHLSRDARQPLSRQLIRAWHAAHRWRRERPDAVLDRRGQLAEVLAVGLEAGLPVDQAWQLAHDCESSGRTGVRVRESDGPTAGGATVGDLLDRALRLSDLSGCPTADAARRAAENLRQQAAAVRQRETLLAGPRASMIVLTVLPVVGPLVSLVVGVQLTEVYAEGWALVSTGLGLALTLAGWRVARRMLRRASEPVLLSVVPDAPLRSTKREWRLTAQGRRDVP